MTAFSSLTATASRLSDHQTGPAIVGWIVFIPLFLIAILLISGKGSSLIAGYNTASPEERAQYNERKLTLTIGVGMLLISLLIPALVLLQDKLPGWFIFVIIGLIAVITIVMLVGANTWCKR